MCGRTKYISKMDKVSGSVDKKRNNTIFQLIDKKNLLYKKMPYLKKIFQ